METVKEALTPTVHQLPLKLADFFTLSEALDYAAQGETGCNFYNGRGRFYSAVSYASLRKQALTLASQLHGFHLGRGARVALVADTTPDFLRFFFACQYAGLVPVPLSASIHLGSRHGYVAQLSRLLENCQPSVAMASSDFFPFLLEAAQGIDLHFLGTPSDFDALPLSDDSALQPSDPQDIAYIQYTSGSTQFPRGVLITQQMVMNNLSGIVKHGLQVRADDRCVSWLPFYHDMGLVGFVLGPVASQRSVDYLSTKDFAMRPRQWLSLISRNQATISFSPTFGYELCARRIRRDEAENFNLRSWRIAGVGAETIRPKPISAFADVLAVSGFDKSAFLPCYGMAECALAVSFAPLNTGFEIDLVESDALAIEQEALPLDGAAVKNEVERVNSFVNCGVPLPGYRVEIRDDEGHVLTDRQCGTIFVHGPSIMLGYFAEPEATKEVLAPDGWLNTGDIGYRVGDRIVITGRKKDLIIINGRNVWPQDLEALAEREPSLRSGDSSAFSVPEVNGTERAVLVVQCREFDVGKRKELVERLQGLIFQEMGIECFIDLVPPHTLPRTSSGKLSRSGAREGFLKRMKLPALIHEHEAEGKGKGLDGLFSRSDNELSLS